VTLAAGAGAAWAGKEEPLTRRRTTMVRMFVRHKVEEYAHWRKVYDEFEATRNGMGVKGHAVFQTVDDPNDVTVWHDFDSREAAQAFASSDQLKQAMANAGVAGAPTIWFTTGG
jgi:heme-degrading monooxygenase HmoA